MTTYRIAEVRRAGTITWVVIATNDDGSRDWLSEHPTALAAQSMADRLAAIQETDGPLH